MRYCRSRLRTSLLLCCSILLASAAHAQYRAGIQGVVTDQTGAVVPDAKITLTSKETNISRTATTVANGVYTIPNLAPGRYTLTVEKEGFKKQLLQDVQVSAEQMQSVNVLLELGQISESLTVTESVTPLLDTESAQISGALTSREVQALPSFGRDPFQLLRLAPGVFGDGSRSAGGGSQNLPGSAGPGGTSATSSIFQTENQVQINANGTRNISNSYQIDGVEVNSLAWGGAAVITPNEESVKEIRIISNNYSAENGRNSGAQVMVVSQNGTNDYHGSLFFKAHRPGLNAYQRWDGPVGPGATTPEQRGLQRENGRFNQFGGSAGGPILKNRLFAFFSYETLRNSSVNTGTGWYETPEFLKSAAAPSSIAGKILSFPGEGASFNAIIPRTCAQIGLPSTQCHDTPNGLDLGSPLTGALGTRDPSFGQPATPYGVGNGFDGVPDAIFVQTTNPTQNTAVQYNGRLDFQVTTKDLIAFSIYWVPVDNTSFNGAIRAANLWNNNRLNYSEALLWNRAFGPTLLNEARFNVTRWHWNEVESNPQEPWGLPAGNIDGIGPVGVNSFGAPGPSIFNQTTYNIRDTLSKVQNSHSLKFGADIYKEQNDDQAPWSARPSYNFKNLWDFANDAPYQENGNFDPLTGRPTDVKKHIRSSIYAFFVQDDWRCKPNLTVNLGLRWEYFSPLSEKDDHISNPILGSGAGLLSGLRLKVGGDLYQASKNNWGPQIGFAWLPHLLGGGDRLVVRGGFGVGYNRMQEAITLNGRFNPPLVAAFTFDPAKLLYAVPADVHQFSDWPVNQNAILTFDPATGLPMGQAVNLQAVPNDVQTPVTYRYSLETQYDLGHNWVASLGYQGSQTRHYTIQNNLNWIYAPLNPSVRNLNWYSNTANASYNALLTELQHRFARSFQVDAQYRWSKTIDQGSHDYYIDLYPYDIGLARGPAEFDVRHDFKLWGVWTPRIFTGSRGWLEKIAGGWELSWILNSHSGFPWTPQYGNTGCNLIYQGSGYCALRPGKYSGAAGTDYSNDALMSGSPAGFNANFPNGALAYFTVPAFVQGPDFPGNGPKPETPGVGRNSFRGPHYFDVDFTLGKAFGLPKVSILGENAKLDIRANFYNVFNKLNLNNVNNTISFDGTTSNRQFGQTQGALAGRIVELQARFSF